MSSAKSKKVFHLIYHLLEGVRVRCFTVNAHSLEQNIINDNAKYQNVPSFAFTQKSRDQEITHKNGSKNDFMGSIIQCRASVVALIVWRRRNDMAKERKKKSKEKYQLERRQIELEEQLLDS